MYFYKGGRQMKKREMNYYEYKAICAIATAIIAIAVIVVESKK